MRVYQAGSHLTEERGVTVRDWSWRQTRRRFKTLGELVAPYKGRAILSVLTLLLSTAIALAPPLLAKTALNDAINGGRPAVPDRRPVPPRRAPELGNDVRADLPDRLGRASGCWPT